MKEKAHEYSTKLKSQAITIDGKTFSVREMTGTQREDWTAGNMDRMVLGEDGKPTGALKDYRGIKMDLLVQSVRNDKGDLVTKDFIDTFPPSLMDVLHGIASEMSGVKVDDEEGKAGNE